MGLRRPVRTTSQGGMDAQLRAPPATQPRQQYAQTTDATHTIQKSATSAPGSSGCRGGEQQG